MQFYLGGKCTVHVHFSLSQGTCATEEEQIDRQDLEEHVSIVHDH